MKLAVKMAGVGLLLAGLVGLVGCAARSDVTTTTPVKQRTGTQLWADRCASCHAMRPPDAYSDAQWKVVVKHMRHQANLTGAEERAIREFLQSAN